MITLLFVEAFVIFCCIDRVWSQLFDKFTYVYKKLCLIILQIMFFSTDSRFSYVSWLYNYYYLKSNRKKQAWVSVGFIYVTINLFIWLYMNIFWLFLRLWYFAGNGGRIKFLKVFFYSENYSGNFTSLFINARGKKLLIKTYWFSICAQKRSKLSFK